jgi:AcrR family transcriptional regulator
MSLQRGGDQLLGRLLVQGMLFEIVPDQPVGVHLVGLRPVPCKAVQASPRRQRLTQQVVVAAAVAVADAEGLDAVSFRRVATELDARTMTLYSHVSSKVELLDLMFDDLAAEILAQGPFPPTWREALTDLATRKRDLCRRHPWAVPLYTQYPRLGPRMLRLLDLSLAAAADLTPDPTRAWQVVCAVDDYTLGYLVRESSAREAPRRYNLTPADYEVTLHQLQAGIIARNDHPHLSAMLTAAPAGPPSGSPLPGDFAQGLTWLLNGISHQAFKPTPGPLHE